jgi:hypothetical protein
MSPVMGTGHHAGSHGTFYFDNEPNVLDQFLINKHLATDTAVLRALPATGEIIRFPAWPRRLPQTHPVRRH